MHNCAKLLDRATDNCHLRYASAAVANTTTENAKRPEARSFEPLDPFGLRDCIRYQPFLPQPPPPRADTSTYVGCAVAAGAATAPPPPPPMPPIIIIIIIICII